MVEAYEVVYRVLTGHRSIRRFKRVPIPEHHVRMILEAGRRAPTDASLHLWTAVRVSDEELRRRIAEATGQPHVAEAPLFLVFLADLHRLERLLRHRGEELGEVDNAFLILAAVDAGIAAQNMAVMAEALGYGTCFIGAVMSAARDVIRILRLPRRVLPLFGLAIGVPDEEPPLRPRLPLSMLVHENGYREYTAEELEEAYRVMAPVTRRGDWLRLLKRYVGRGGVFEERSRELPELLREQGFRVTC